jgi:putative sterol carrier protein
MSVADNLNLIFEKMPEAFIPEAAAGVKATILVSLSGEAGGNWLLRIADGLLAVEAGEMDEPNLTLTMQADDYVAMTKGEINPMSLFMGGKIKVSGDMGLALKFQNMFDRNRVQ